MLLKVGELAKRSGLTVRTLHHFDQIGLLQPSARSEAGYRLYSRDDVARLHGIQALRHLGLPLKEIGSMLAGDGCALPTIMARQIRALDHEITQATELRMARWRAHFTLEDMSRFCWVPLGEWRAVDAELQSLIVQRTPPDDPAARAACARADALVSRSVGGDPRLLGQLAGAMAAEPVLRAGMKLGLETLAYLKAVRAAKGA